MSIRAVFLDRDGTINEDPGYLFDPALVKLFPDTKKSLSLLKNRHGFMLIVISNQSGIARGLITREQVEAVNNRINKILSSEDAEIDRFYYCPFHPEFNTNEECVCRKPSPYLIFEASKDFNIDLSKSFFIGDSVSDIECAINAGVKSILVKTGNGKESFSVLKKQEIFPTFVAENLADASNLIIHDISGED